MKLFIILFLCLYLKSCEKLFYGDYLIINPNQKIVSSKEKIYLVKKGDNLHSIAKKNFVALRELIEINSINYPYKIFPNQKIVIPKVNFHYVKEGETLYSISRMYDLDRYKLASINGLDSKQLIFPNQKLIISKNFKKFSKKYKNNKNKEKKEKQQKSTESFIWPVKGQVISKFGEIKPGLHNDGINIKSSLGEDVLASKDGKVVYIGNEIPGYGNLILIKHKGNWITAYAHLKKIFIERGSYIKKGTKIGEVGSTGNVIEPQLHFEIRRGKRAVNPKEFLV